MQCHKKRDEREKGAKVCEEREKGAKVCGKKKEKSVEAGKTEHHKLHLHWALGH
jgi:hypothetical protein